MTGIMRRLLADEAGQDLVEYALLASFVGFACIGVFDELREAVRTTYQAWNSQNNNLWRPPNPGP